MNFLILRDGHLRLNLAQIASIEGNVVTMSSRATLTLATADMQMVLKALERNRSTVPVGITMEDNLPVAEFLKEMTGKQRAKAGK